LEPSTIFYSIRYTFKVEREIIMLRKKFVSLEEILSRSGTVHAERPDIVSLTHDKEPIVQKIGCDRAAAMEPFTLDRPTTKKIQELLSSDDTRVSKAAVAALQRHGYRLPV
jgi:hypothetical protein